MANDEETEKQISPTVAATPQKTTTKMGKFWRILLWLVVILALAAGGFLATRTFERYDGLIHHQGEQLARQAAWLGSLGNELQTEKTRQLDEIRSLQAKIDALSAQLLGGEETLAPRLSEVLYLIRLADHRLTFFQDVRTTAQILRTAMERISPLKDPNLQPIREKLSSAVSDVQRMEVTDATDISLKINRAIDALIAIPASMARSTSPPPKDASKAPDWQKGLQQTWEKLKKLVTVKQLNTTAKPFLLPEEHALVLWNVRLELEQAKLAAWRGEAMAYNRSLKMASAWISQNLDAEQERTHSVLKMLEELSRVTWVVPKPNFGELMSLVHKTLDEAQAM